MKGNAAQLSPQQLTALVRSVFNPGAEEQGLTLLMDIPRDGHPDNPDWVDRRNICFEWYRMLSEQKDQLPFSDMSCFNYGDVGSNNNDLPELARQVGLSGVTSGPEVSLRRVLERSSVVIAMTEYSATAPLKLLGKELGFRGATMPGFSRKMIPALGLDYEEVNEKVVRLKRRMDVAESIELVLESPQGTHESIFDTRFREGHASGGLMREPGIVGNLPSGEAYIVPYEGERKGVVSRSEGTLPVQFGDEVVIYHIHQNRACKVVSDGRASNSEAEKLDSEPAYGNIAEIGIGVLGEWGVVACGNTLLDEKLGLHVAFGRSDHFGGIIAPSSFRKPINVVHIDRVYVPSVQPDIRVRRVTFNYGGEKEQIIENDEIQIR